MSSELPVKVENLADLSGQYLKNTRDDRVYKITDVGREGVTVYEAHGYGGETGGPEITLTWRLVKTIYVLLVHAAEIDVKANQVAN